MTFKPVLTGFAGRKAICDAETYPNFILIKFEDVDTGEVHRFVIDETRNESTQHSPTSRACPSSSPTTATDLTTTFSIRCSTDTITRRSTRSPTT